MDGMSGVIPYSCELQSNSYGLLSCLDGIIQESKGCKILATNLHIGYIAILCNGIKKDLREGKKSLLTCFLVR